MCWRRRVSSPDRETWTWRERPLRRVVFALMTNPFALPILGGSLLAAVAAGIHLGESAVSMIDPVHFRGPAVHPRDRGAALDERALLASRAPAPRLYGWEEGHAARARMAGCDGCAVFDDGDSGVYSAVVPYFGGDDVPAKTRGPVDPEPVPSVRVHRGSDRFAGGEPEMVEVDRRSDSRIERYAHFPLGYEEAAFSAPLSEPRPIEDEQVNQY
jgi:hypothetical protein